MQCRGLKVVDLLERKVFSIVEQGSFSLPVMEDKTLMPETFFKVWSHEGDDIAWWSNGGIEGAIGDRKAHV